MSIPKKRLYGFKLFVNYGHGWEYETFEETFAEFRVQRRAYAENCAYPHKWKRGYEDNPEYYNYVNGFNKR